MILAINTKFPKLTFKISQINLDFEAINNKKKIVGSQNVRKIQSLIKHFV